MPPYPYQNPYGPWADVYTPQDPYAPGANVPSDMNGYAPDISEPVMMGGGGGGGGFDWGTAAAGGGIGGELGDALGSIVDLIAGGEDRAKVTDYLQKTLGLYKDFNPNEQVSVLGPSAYNTIQRDPNLRAQETASLAHLKGVADADGLDAGARAKLDAVQRSNAEAAYGQQRGILAGAARRGAAAPGRDLVASQMAAQGSADRNSSAGLNIAADAEDRALQAALAGGEMAGRMGRDDWTRGALTAGANDAVSRFNAQNLQNVFERNIARDWQKRQGMAGAYGDLAQDRQLAATRWQRMGRGIGRGVGSAVGFGAGGILGGR